MDNSLLENWDATKEALLEGLNTSQKDVVGPLLENQKDYLIKETAAAGSIQAHDIANFRKTLLPMIRRIIPGTIATELVGVQPMSGPVGLVYTLRYKYEEDMTHNAASSQFGGYDIASGDEAFGNASPIRQFYAGNTGAAQDAGASGIDAAGADGTSAPADIDAATAEGGAWESSQDVTTYGTGTSDFSGYSVAVGGSMLGGSSSFEIWDKIDQSHGHWDPDHLAIPGGRSDLTGGMNCCLGTLEVQSLECQVHAAQSAA